ncbi:uncharacterized protein Z520_08134 [Fonsecaea multimorphosa CBS 102226]|uniref:Clr5 domain-containing protein n=1 Tax=Fonsecaea multimorphosa CBS 102226 TaxID=1442371 RepID=A0A0D2IH26_9EURO|nr:uncharacterized protein Z520_08134 [Fonsecaea multimorphosa CBS 102226]KIX96356.1 hypothetical protein Z520_08134 [Fonsecaea multimorphosa CBS 102226]OAL22015.1 hypothetical protein AYO22_07612 [Fonsecaea multimorphosa]
MVDGGISYIQDDNSGYEEDLEVDPEHQHAEQDSQSRRVVGPTPQQWIDIKDVFSQLYIAENRKLKDVRTILRKKYGFNASEKMFKRRITEWKIHKNYKAKDKELLAKRVKEYVDAGHDIQSISFRGRPLKLDRVKRHYRSDKRFTQLWEQLSQSPESVSVGDMTIKDESPSIVPNRSRTLPNSSTPPTDSDSIMQDSNGSDVGSMTINVLPPTDLYNMQCSLFHTREAVQWQFTAFNRLKMNELQHRFPNSIPEEVKAGQTDQVSAFWLGLYHGFDYLQTGRSSEAWKNFDVCSSMVQPLLHSAPVQLLSCLLVHFATPWLGMAALEQHLLSFVSSMAANTFGKDHPYVKALRMMVAADSRNRIVESMMQLIVEGYSARRRPSNSSLFALRVDQIDMLRKRKNFQPAHHMCQQLIKDSQSMPPKRYRTALAALGRLYADQNEEFAVEGVAHRILQHETSDSGTTNSGSAAWACDQLATLCLSRKEYGLAERYLRRAARMSYTGLPHRGPSTDSFTQKLDSCLRQQGKRGRLSEIHEEPGMEQEETASGSQQ